MAAISYPSTLSPRRSAQPLVPAPGGPSEHHRHLRLIHGGVGVRRHPAPAVYARRRLVALVLAVVVALALFTALQWVGSSLVVRPAPATAPVAPASAAAVHIVQPGETVWTIARDLEPEGDLRATVDRLVARNGGADLQVGQQLVLD